MFCLTELSPRLSEVTCPLPRLRSGNPGIPAVSTPGLTSFESHSFLSLSFSISKNRRVCPSCSGTLWGHGISRKARRAPWRQLHNTQCLAPEGLCPDPPPHPGEPCPGSLPLQDLVTSPGAALCLSHLLSSRRSSLHFSWAHAPPLGPASVASPRNGGLKDKRKP